MPPVDLSFYLVFCTYFRTYFKRLFCWNRVKFFENILRKWKYLKIFWDLFCWPSAAAWLGLYIHPGGSKLFQYLLIFWQTLWDKYSPVLVIFLLGLTSTESDPNKNLMMRQADWSTWGKQFVLLPTVERHLAPHLGFANG